MTGAGRGPRRWPAPGPAARPETGPGPNPGVGLCLAGLGVGAVALVVFLWSAGLGVDDPAYWPAREAAFALAAVALPAFLLGVVLLLPVDRRPVLAAGVGGLLCLAAVAVFVWAYPARWDLARATDATAPAVALYAAGVAVVAGSTWAGLRAAPTARDGLRDVDDGSNGPIAAHERPGPGRASAPEPRTADHPDGPTGSRDPDAPPAADPRPAAGADGGTVADAGRDRLRRLFREHDADRGR